MADELNKNAEFSGKHQNKEDPILAAQRYLNIYRQIHIFNKKRQDEFDNSLLEMPSDLRILLSTLPGGSLLLEHISKLEEQKGIINSDSLTDALKDTDSSKGEKFSSFTTQPTYKQNDAVGLPNNFMKIFQQTEEKHAKELQALTNAFLKSQEQLANIFQQVLGSKQLSASNNQEPTESQKTESEEKTSKNKHKKKNKSVETAPNEKNTNSNQSEDIKTVSDEEKKTNNDETENQAPETTSKILSFTKKLFHKSSAESENVDIPNSSKAAVETQDSSILIDTTPVSLDDVSDEKPVVLDTPETKDTKPEILQSDDSELPEAPSEEALPEAPQADEDWEWEYVDDDNEDSDDQWEYVEEPEDAITDQTDESLPDTPAEENIETIAETAEDVETPLEQETQQTDSASDEEQIALGDDSAVSYTETVENEAYPQDVANEDLNQYIDTDDSGVYAYDETATGDNLDQYIDTADDGTYTYDGTATGENLDQYIDTADDGTYTYDDAAIGEGLDQYIEPGDDATYSYDELGQSGEYDETMNPTDEDKQS